MTKAEMVAHTIDGWNVEYQDENGSMYVATFTGPDDESRACAYMNWINKD